METETWYVCRDHLNGYLYVTDDDEAFDACECCGCSDDYIADFDTEAEAAAYVAANE